MQELEPDKGSYTVDGKKIQKNARRSLIAIQYANITMIEPLPFERQQCKSMENFHFFFLNNVIFGLNVL